MTDTAKPEATEKIIEIVESVTDWRYVAAALVVGAIGAAVVMFLFLDYASRDERGEGSAAPGEQPGPPALLD